MAPVPVKRLFETHLTVADLERSIAFYRDVVGLELAHRVPDRQAAFFWMGGRGASMLGLWSIGSSPLRLRLHLAFEVALRDVEAAASSLRAQGLRPHDGSGKTITEPVVIAWMPAASVFFEDPDGHSLEYLAMLDGPSREDWGWIPLSDWRKRVDDAAGR